MANTVQRKEVGGECIHVRDCYVRTEIHYLDSPSDYRESLPQDRYWNPDNGLAMLPSTRRSSRSDSDFPLTIVFFMVAILMACFSVLR
jgi:hypothetical protein